MQHIFDLLSGNVVAALIAVVVAVLLGLRLHSVRYSDPSRSFEARFGKPRSDNPDTSDIVEP
jgi:hypothetical protein